MSNRRRLGFLGGLALGAGFLGSCLAEGALRYRDTGSPFTMPPSYWIADEELIYRPNPDHPETPGGTRRSGVWTGPPPTLRVLALGGSTTYGYGVEWDETWPHVAERALRDRGHRARVLNAGVNGYGSRQLLIWYRREFAELDADVLVIYSGWNRTGATIDRGEWWPHTERRDGDPWTRSLSGALTKRSLLYARLRSLTQRWRFEAASDDFELDPYPSLFAEDLSALVAEARGQNQHVLMVVYPALFQLDMDEQERNAVSSRFFMEKNFKLQMLEELENKQNVIRDVALREGASVVDVDAAISHIRGPDRHALFLDEAHLSASGNALVGQVIAEAISQIVQADDDLPAPSRRPH